MVRVVNSSLAILLTIDARTRWPLRQSTLEGVNTYRRHVLLLSAHHYNLSTDHLSVGKKDDTEASEVLNCLRAFPGLITPLAMSRRRRPTISEEMAGAAIFLTGIAR